MSWRNSLTPGGVERVIDKALLILLALIAGFGLGIFYCRDDFKKGADYMQRAYSQGYVVREVIKK